MRYLLALALLLVAGSAAADGVSRHGFWGDIDIGFGRLNLAPDVAPNHGDTRFYFALAGGYTVHPQLQLGVEAGGWNIEFGNPWDSTRGEGVMQLFAVARYWPTPNSGLFIKAGLGNVSHWNNASGSADGHGAGYCVGLGYELSRFGGTDTYWFLNYNAGRVSGYRPPGGVAQSEAYNALTAGLSFGF